MIRWRPILPMLGLRGKLLVLVSAIVSFILAAQTVVWLSSAVTDLDHRIAAQGVIQAQGIAAGCVDLLRTPDRSQLATMVARVGKVIAVQAVEVLDATGKVLLRHGPAPPAAARALPLGVFDRPRRGPGLLGLAGGAILYAAQAPIVRDGQVVGHVSLTWKSMEIAQKSTRLIGAALTMALVWLTLGAGLGTLYVHRITRPLQRLTRAAQRLGQGELQVPELRQRPPGDEVATLHNAFARLVAEVQAQRARNADLLGQLQAHNLRLQERVDATTAQLRDRMAQLVAVVTALAEGVVAVDLAQGVLEVNPAALRHLTGLGRPCPGRPLAELLPQAEGLHRAVAAVLAGEPAQALTVDLPSETPPHGHAHPGGEGGLVRHLQIHIAPVEAAGQLSGAVLVLHDATADRWQAARLRQQDRLVSLGTLAAGIAHEFGNAMHAIDGFAALLVRQTADDDPRHSDAATLRGESRRAIALIDRFLQFARPRRLSNRPESLAALCDEALAICAWRLRQVAAEARVINDLGETQVECDGQQLVQVLVNLVLNAADAMAELPRRVLALRVRPAGRGFAAVDCTDSGIGIASEHLDRVCDPFFSTKPMGTGLGLAIAHQIIAGHGGSIRVRNHPGGGACVSLRLPLVPPRANAPHGLQVPP